MLSYDDRDFLLRVAALKPLEPAPDTLLGGELPDNEPEKADSGEPDEVYKPDACIYEARDLLLIEVHRISDPVLRGKE